MKWLAAFVVAVALGAGHAPALAQEYPSRPVRILVGTSAGGVTDAMARVFARYLLQKTGQPGVVENNPGAGGNLASANLARSAPDGYTLTFASAGTIVINPFLYRNMGFDPLAFVAVASLVEAPQLVVVPADLPVRTLQDFIALARRAPNNVAYASAGVGSTPHLAAEMLARAAGIEMVHVPYRGTAPGITDLLAGRVQMLSISAGPVIAHLQAGTLKALAVLAPTRLPEFPDVPTTAEAGVPNLEMSTWFGMFAPAGTPAPIVERLNGLARALLADPEERRKLQEVYAVPMSMGVAEFGALVRSDAANWGRMVAALGVQLD